LVNEFNTIGIREEKNPKNESNIGNCICLQLSDVYNGCETNEKAEKKRERRNSDRKAVKRNKKELSSL